MVASELGKQHLDSAMPHKLIPHIVRYVAGTARRLGALVGRLARRPGQGRHVARAVREGAGGAPRPLPTFGGQGLRRGVTLTSASALEDVMQGGAV